MSDKFAKESNHMIRQHNALIAAASVSLICVILQLQLIKFWSRNDYSMANDVICNESNQIDSKSKSSTKYKEKIMSNLYPA